MSNASFKGGESGGGSNIQIINGDTGSITGSTVTIFADNAANNSGATVKFVNSGTTSTFDVTDANFNTYIGQGAGVASIGFGSTAFGVFALQSITGGIGGNNSFGDNSLGALKTGVANLAFGTNAGSSYTSAESSNIVIGNEGNTGESNVIRIGEDGSGPGQQNQCHIAGINGVTVPNQLMVVINSAANQLGTAAIPAGASMGPYIVGTEDANYATIQAAINAANATGFYNSSNPVDIVLKPKANSTYYVENPLLFDGINLVALATVSYPGQDDDFQNSVVIKGTISAPLTDQSLNRIVNIQIQAPNSSPIADFPAIGLTNEIDFVGCQLIPASSPMFTSTGGTDTCYVIFDKCTIEGSGSGRTFCDDATLNGSLLNIFMTNSHGVVNGTTTLANSTLSITGYNSDLYMNYEGSSTAIIALSMFGCAGKGFQSDSFGATEWDAGSSIIMENCPVKAVFDFEGISPTPGLATFTNCDMFDNFSNPPYTTFAGNCPPTLINCPNACGYSKSKTVTGNSTALVTDDVIFVDTSGGAHTITLYGQPFQGMKQTVTDATGSGLTNNITVNGNGNNINGASTDSIITAFGSATYVYNGTIWNVI